MANAEHLAILAQGVEAWNAWRREHADVRPNLHAADLQGANLRGMDLVRAQLVKANLSEADLRGADLRGADLGWALLFNGDLRGADLRGAHLHTAHFFMADLRRADLRGANLAGVHLVRAKLCGADLSEADLGGWANLCAANLAGANLRGANLQEANLVEANLVAADLTGCRVYGLSAWRCDLKEATQKDLIITREDEPEVTVDNLEVAQFVHLVLHSEQIRGVIDTIAKKGVLLLGRFTEGRLAILERLREELRSRGFVPMVFNFDKPETRDFTETVRLLAGLSRFVIADITNPRSAPLELQATVPECMIPFVTILERGEEPFAMFQDLWVKHREWVLEPIAYPSVDALVDGLDAAIVRPALERSAQLLARKAERLRVRDIEEFVAGSG